ncbi:uncharacterized protein DKFZp434B061-like [Corapipo altera]|uniref:uncharacterized protein DKFZp434B061-like n=1 Tax=Corapipo altera TaxID=415028 RepID=UPI000FD6A302|nr:uncharacterized protein DKFZp434B061-like [Corapipo altera]
MSFIVVPGRAPAACPRRQGVLASGRPGPAGPPAGFPTRGPELLGAPTTWSTDIITLLPCRSLTRGKAVPQASPRQEGNSHRGAARTRTHTHAPPARCRGSPHTRTPPVSGAPRGDALAARARPPPSAPSGALPATAVPGGPGRPPPHGAPPPPAPGAPEAAERAPPGRPPPRAPLPGGDHAHSPPQEGITQGSLLLICIHLQAGYSPHFLTACHRQRPVPAASPSCAGSAGRAAGRGAPGTVPVPASAQSRHHRGDLPVRRFYRLTGFPGRLALHLPPRPRASRAALRAPATDPAAQPSALSAAARPPAPRRPAPETGSRRSAPRRRQPPRNHTGCQLVPVTGDDRRAGRRRCPRQPLLLTWEVTEEEGGKPSRCPCSSPSLLTVAEGLVLHGGEAEAREPQPALAAAGGSAPRCRRLRWAIPGTTSQNRSYRAASAERARGARLP